MLFRSLRDLQAAQTAGCQPHLVCTGRAALVQEAELAQWQQAVPGARIHADLAAFADHLLGVARP